VRGDEEERLEYSWIKIDMRDESRIRCGYPRREIIIMRTPIGGRNKEKRQKTNYTSLRNNTTDGMTGGAATTMTATATATMDDYKR
jgi:hypothetical protein